MPEVQLVIGGLLVVTILAAFAERARLPQAVVVVLGGLGLGFVPGAPDVRLDPAVIFLVFLPPILYPAAFEFAAEDIRGNLRPIAFLAIGLVLVTVCGVAGVAHFALGLGWTAAFVLGAIVSPTDPVAATAVLRRVGAPSRIATILEGESLVNDGTGLTVFKLSVSAAGATSFSAGSAVRDFVWTIVAGSAIGAVAGWLSTEARRRLDQPAIAITLALVTAYGAFLVADEVGVSGILATVSAGLVVGWRSLELGSAETRLQSTAFWQVVSFIAESLLFLLVGLQFQSVLEPLNESAARLGGEALLVIAVVLGLRAVGTFTVAFLLRAFPGQPVGGEPVTSRAELAVISLGGMRGAVTVAAALSIPLAAGGHPFPDRELLIFLSYATVFGTLVPIALALPPLLRVLGLAQTEEARRRALEARLRVIHAALERADELGREGRVPEEALRRAREIYEMRLAQAEAEATTDEAAQRGGDLSEAYRQIRRELVQAERRALAELRTERSVPGDALRELEREVDLEEARLRG
jgi:CPA1 family monovalent cation:H+ antiporter